MDAVKKINLSSTIEEVKEVLSTLLSSTAIDILVDKSIMNHQCSLCPFFASEWQDLSKHLIRRHRNAANFIVHCGAEGCGASFSNYRSFQSHCSRKHYNETYDTGDNDNAHVSNMDICDEGSDENADEELTDRHAAGAYVLKLKARHKLSEAAVSEIIDSTTELFNLKLKELRSQITPFITTDIPQTPEFDDLFNSTDLFAGLQSNYQQEKYFVDHFAYVKPQQVKISERVVNKKVSGTYKLTTVNLMGYYVPFLDQLTALLRMPEVRKYVCNNPLHRESNLAYDFFDGSFVASSQYLSSHPSALCFAVYTDDFELVNPIGSHRSKHKITAFYWILLNIPPEYRSKLQCIQLLAVASSKAVRENGMSAILKDFISSIKSLYDGVELQINGVAEHFYGSLLCVMADTPAGQLFGAFKESVGAAQKPCRTCEVSSDQLNSSTNSADFYERDEQEHLDRIDQLKGISTKAQVYWSRVYGVKGDTVLRSIPDFVITKCILQDPMHLLFEDNEVDGGAFLLLVESDIFTMFPGKVGVARKLTRLVALAQDSGPTQEAPVSVPLVSRLEASCADLNAADMSDDRQPRPSVTCTDVSKAGPSSASNQKSLDNILPVLPQFSNRVRRALESGRPMEEWRKLMEDCAYHLLGNSWITKKGDYKPFCIAMFRQYPCIGNNSGDNPWTFFKDTLSQKVRNIRWDTNRKRQLSHDPDKQPSPKTKRTHNLVSVVIEDDSTPGPTAQDAKQVMLDEFQKPVSAQNKPLMCKLQKISYKERRVAISTMEDCAVRKIVDEWPCLKILDYISKEYQLMTGTDGSGLEETWQKMIVTLESCIGGMASKPDDAELAAIELLLSLQEKLTVSGKTSKRFQPAFSICAADVANLECNEKDSPRLVFIQNDGGSIQGAWIIADRIKLMCNGPLHVLVSNLMMAYYAWDLSYPKQYQVLGFLQRHLMGDEKSPFKAFSSFVKLERKFVECQVEAAKET